MLQQSKQFNVQNAQNCTINKIAQNIQKSRDQNRSIMEFNKQIQHYSLIVNFPIKINLSFLIIFIFNLGLLITPINNQCPLNNNGQQVDILIGSLIIGAQLNNNNIQITGNSNQDNKCYNYTLQKQFYTSYSVATSLTQFNSQYTNDLFLSIKPISLQNNINFTSQNIITFIVRTPWKYTYWNRVRFNFIVQQRNDIQVGIYQVQTAILAGCSRNKQIQVFFPYNNNFTSVPSLTTYLTGFQISSKIVNVNGNKSPFQLSQRILSKNITGFTLSFLVTSQTLINSLAISFVSYDNRLVQGQNILSQNYIYQNYQLKQSLSFTAYQKANFQVNILNVRSIFSGLTGFVMPLGKQGNQDNFFSALFNSGGANGKYSFNFNSNNGFLYLSYSYFGLLGNLCNLCSEYPYLLLNSSCVTSCPLGTFLIENNCLSCSTGMVWNGTSCVYLCTGGRLWNLLLNSCQCPLSNNNWNGSVCITCQNNQVWDSLSLTCSCSVGSNWNGTNCIICQNGKIWNFQSKNCQCPTGMFWNDIKCIRCNGGSIWNSTYNVCLCLPGTSWLGNLCVSNCKSNQIWNSLSKNCQCPQYTNWNGINCVSCTGNQTWNIALNNCQCPLGTTYMNNMCINIKSCIGGKIYNIDTNICECPINKYWDNLSLICTACPLDSYLNLSVNQCVCKQTNKFYNQINKKCECQNGYQISLINTSCVLLIKSCPTGQVYNGLLCICQVGYYYNGSNCITYIPDCPSGTLWQVYQCVCHLGNLCPIGMIWVANQCLSSQQSQCAYLTGQAFYWNGSSCVQLSSRCPATLQWKNNTCLPISKNCPSGSYYNGYLCVSYTNCEQNQNMIWNSNLVKCVCVEGSFWNGVKCLICDYGMIYTSNSEGCMCPIGKFFNGTYCSQLTNQNYCKIINYTKWNGTHCICNPGYSVVNNKCQCYGLKLSGWCNRCYLKQNSYYKNGICTCFDGYFQFNGYCKLLISVNSTTTISNVCNTGTYWDSQMKQCLQCSDGCLACINCYKCLQCDVGFNFNPRTQLCQQICGDGKRFRIQCDDANNNNNDGCSMDCKIENEYTCLGGSPNSKDLCSKNIPTQITMIQTGQSHLYGKIILNIQVNYLPFNLTSLLISSCSLSQCDKLLIAQIISGDKSSTSIKSQFLGGAYNSFSLIIQFGHEPVQQFTLQVSINQELKSKYFFNVDISKKLIIIVSPAYLTLFLQKDILI